MQVVEQDVLEPLLVGQPDVALPAQHVTGVVERLVDVVPPEVAAEPVQGEQREQERDLEEQPTAEPPAPPDADVRPHLDAPRRHARDRTPIRSVVGGAIQSGHGGSGDGGDRPDRPRRLRRRLPTRPLRAAPAGGPRLLARADGAHARRRGLLVGGHLRRDRGRAARSGRPTPRSEAATGPHGGTLLQDIEVAGLSSR